MRPIINFSDLPKEDIHMAVIFLTIVFILFWNNIWENTGSCKLNMSYGSFLEIRPNNSIPVPGNCPLFFNSLEST